MDLMDYDFEIVYKPGKINTNADALSRIKIDSDVLKAMIPTNINVITRAQAKQKEENTDNKKADESTVESDQLYIWDCTSISETRNIKSLEFKYYECTRNKLVANKIESLPKIIFKEKGITVHFSDNLI